VIPAADMILNVSHCVLRESVESEVLWNAATGGVKAVSRACAKIAAVRRFQIFVSSIDLETS
jgi:hypothetical protein